MIFNKFNKSNVILEKPIHRKKDDQFNVISYVNQIKKASKQKAIFIAIDGDYGSGKSSIINLLKEKLQNRKNKFIQINSLNTTSIDDFHQHFINNVANQIVKDPYEIENLFYKKTYAYTTIKPDTKKLWKIIVDKFLLIIFSLLLTNIFMSTFLSQIYSSFITTFELATYIEKLNPILLIMALIFIIIYGYGFVKPDEDKISPILDVDKNRNNFLKILINKVKKNTTLYFIVDDMDRLDDKSIQLKIIALLYNEYYSLDQQIKNISLRFIFMINLKTIDIENSVNTINCEKIFDYIVNISNNQNEILEVFSEDIIKKNSVLQSIFDEDTLNNFVPIILNKNDNIRSLKHFFNKLITKYTYIKSKKTNDFEINCKLLILISILEAEIIAENLDSDLSCILQNEKDKIMHIKDEKIIELLTKNIDENYLIYIYNFIDQRNLLNIHEQEIANFMKKNPPLLNLEKFYKLLEVFNKQYIDIKKILKKYYIMTTNETKIALLSIEQVSNILKSNNFKYLSEVNYTNLYKNEISYEFVKNNYGNINSSILFSDIYELLHTDIEEEKIVCNEKICIALDNLKEQILNLDTKSIFNVFNFNKEVFDKLIKYNLLESLFINDIIKISQIENYMSITQIQTMSKIDLAIEKLIQTKNDEFFKNIITSDIIISNFYDIVNDKMPFNNIFLEGLIIILNKYGYNTFLDKYIISKADTVEKRKILIENLNQNKFNLSIELLKFINSNIDFIKIDDYYLSALNENKLFELNIQNDIIKFDYWDIFDYYHPKTYYNKALLNVFLNSSNNTINLYKISPKAITIIFKQLNDDIISDLDVNKILYLVNFGTYNQLKSIISKIDFGKINNVSSLYCKQLSSEKNKLILLRDYVNDKYIKSSLTKRINKY